MNSACWGMLFYLFWVFLSMCVFRQCKIIPDVSAFICHFHLLCPSLLFLPLFSFFGVSLSLWVTSAVFRISFHTSSMFFSVSFIFLLSGIRYLKVFNLPQLNVVKFGTLYTNTASAEPLLEASSLFCSGAQPRVGR